MPSNPSPAPLQPISNPKPSELSRTQALRPPRPATHRTHPSTTKPFNAPPTGAPVATAFLFSSGQIEFRMSATHSDACATATGAVSDWTIQHTLRFVHTVGTGNCFTLQTYVDGVEKKSCSVRPCRS